MKPFLQRILNVKDKNEIFYNEIEIINFYNQLVKMKKKRQHLNILNLLNRCYPNSKKDIADIIKKNGYYIDK